MNNQDIKTKLARLKEQATQLGIEYLNTQTPFDLSDTKIILKPFVDLDISFNKALKKVASDNSSGLIPKTNNLKS